MKPKPFFQVLSLTDIYSSIYATFYCIYIIHWLDAFMPSRPEAIPSFMLNPLLANSCSTTLFNLIIASLDNLLLNLEKVSDLEGLRPGRWNDQPPARMGLWPGGVMALHKKNYGL